MDQRPLTIEEQKAVLQAVIKIIDRRYLLIGWFSGLLIGWLAGGVTMLLLP